MDEAQTYSPQPGSVGSQPIARPPLRRSVIWALSGNVVYAACQWGMIVALAKLGPAAAVGNFSLALAIGAPIVLLCNMQLRGVLATDAHRSYRFVDCLTLRGLTAVAAVVSIAGCCWWCGYRGTTAAVILLVGLAKASESVSDVAYGLLQQRERMPRIAISMFLKGGLTLAAFCLVLQNGGDETSATLAMALLWAGLLLVFDLPQAWHSAGLPAAGRGWRPNPAELRRLGLLAFPLGFVEMLGSLNVNLPRYAIERHFGTLELGAFAAMGYVMVAGGTVVHALTQAAVPRLAQAFADGKPKDFLRFTHRLLAITAGVGLAGVLVAAVGGRQLLTILYRAEYAQRQDAFVLLMLAATAHYLSTVLWFALTATRHYRVQVPVFVGTLLLNFVLCWLLVPGHGMLGAAGAFAIAEGCRAVWSYAILGRIVRAAQRASQPGARRKVVVVTAAEMTVKAFLRGHLAALCGQYDVTVITSTRDPDLLARLSAPARVVPLAMARGIRPFQDLKCLWALWWLFRRERFDAVFSVMPKSGLLAMAAGLLVRAPTRLHMFTGQAWATRQGWSRRGLKAADWFIARCATNVLADSHSQREFLVRQRVVAAARVQVLAQGSICGVDTRRFRPDPAARTAVRAELGVPEEAVLLLFLGRLNRDKGVLDLGQAFALLAAGHQAAHLAIVGPDEGGFRDGIRRACARCADRLHFVDFTDRPECYMAAADLFCLPSYREGFGSVVIEAAATAVPAVASRIYGLTDAVEDGRTGLLHQPGDAQQIAACLNTLLNSPAQRLEFGQAARQRAVEQFPAERVTAAFMEYLHGCLHPADAAVHLSAADPSAIKDAAVTWPRNWLKRGFDIVAASLLLAVSAPIMLLVALAVRIWLGRPILFRQTRIGQGNVPFSLCKFRTMRDQVGPDGQPLSDAQRLTKLGRFLRRASLDELPQLLNVLRGEMSLIGPRPLLTQYLPRYSQTQLRRHEVRPGITGWAQVNGRNQLDWEQRFQLDVWYVDRASLWLDIKILWLTAHRVLFARGVSQSSSQVTMTEFQGNQPMSQSIATGSPDKSLGPVVVLGAGGHAKVVIATLEAAGHTIRGVYDDNSALWGQRVLGHLVTGPIERSSAAPGAAAIIAIGSPDARSKLAARLPLHWISVVHPAAVVHTTVRVGPGSVVFAGAVVQPESVIGDHVVLNTGCSVDHDCTIADFANVGPGVHLAGNVRIGPRSDLGTGCVVIPGLEVGESSVVGAGAVVVDDIPAEVVAVGCPARVIRARSAPLVAQPARAA